jgi:DNA-binding NtrC family response regulator
MTSRNEQDEQGGWGGHSAERTARRPRHERPGAPSFEIVVIEGADTGRKYTLEAAGSVCLLVGKSALCGVHLSDPSIAPRHCSFEIVGQHLRLVDFSSATRVNGVLTAEAFLLGGETVRVGDTALAIRRKGRGPTATRVSPFPRFQGDSAVLCELYPRLTALAHSSRPLLIVGERGVGKSLLAEELHQQSVTKDAPFVTVERGTAAEVARALFEGRGSAALRAAGGTLLIEEAADLDEAGQRRLLALIGRAERTCRIIAATSKPTALSRDLWAAFGKDRVTVPALRDRDGDVNLLARRFWVELGGSGSLPDDFVSRFEGHLWPGNVRELRIAVEDRIRHGDESTASCEQPSQRPQSSDKDVDSIEKVLESDLPLVQARREILAEFERRYVEHALERSGRNVARAAAASGIAHRYFQRLKSRRRHA